MDPSAPVVVAARRTQRPSRASRKCQQRRKKRPVTEYGLALAVLAILAVLTKRREIIASAMVVALSWVLWCAFIFVSEVYEPWHFGILLDSAAAWVLLKNPSSRPKALLGSIFTVQITMHIAYASVLLISGDADYVSYYNQLSVTSWLQLLIVGAWAGGNNLRRIVRFRSAVHPLRHHAHSRNMGDAS